MNPVSKLLALPELADYDLEQKRRILIKWWEWRWRRYGFVVFEMVTALAIYALSFFVCERARELVFASFNPLNLLSAGSALISVWLSWISVVHYFYISRHSELKKIKRKLVDCKPRIKDTAFSGPGMFAAPSFHESIELPAEYVSWFESKKQNRKDLSNSLGSFSFWPPEEVDEYNEKLDMSRLAPGFLAFGSSGTGELAAIDQRGSIYILPMVDQEASYARKVAESWTELSGQR